MSILAVVWVIVTWLAIGAGIVCSIAALAVGVLTVVALVMGGECEDEEENRVMECRQMALGLSGSTKQEGETADERG